MHAWIWHGSLLSLCRQVYTYTHTPYMHAWIWHGSLLSLCRQVYAYIHTPYMHACTCTYACMHTSPWVWLATIALSPGASPFFNACMHASCMHACMHTSITRGQERRRPPGLSNGSLGRRVRSPCCWVRTRNACMRSHACHLANHLLISSSPHLLISTPTSYLACLRTCLSPCQSSHGALAPSAPQDGSEASTPSEVSK